MTTRIPLVLDGSGLPAELPSGDTLAGMPTGPILSTGTAVDVNTTTTETTIADATIPAGLPGANGAVDLEIIGDFLQNGGGTSTLQIAVKYGSTTLWLDVTTAQTAIATIRHPFWMKVRLAGANSANAQVVGGIVILGTAAAATNGLGDLAAVVANATGAHTSFVGTSAENSATSLHLKVTVKHSVSNALTSFRALHVSCNSVAGVGATGATGAIGPSGAGTVNVPTNAQTGTTYTAQASDVGKSIDQDNSSPCTITIPNGVFTVSNVFYATQIGTGAVTLASDGTSVLHKPHTLTTGAQWAMLTVRHWKTVSGVDHFIVTGEST